MERLGIHGSIIMSASLAGNVALQGVPSIAYGASKSAVIQMARSMACELGPKGIRVNSISPGYIETK
jgi:NAD(P)-dependent dehydrogenase (short-subunit alcohol dehydrogenase family)